jgi:hypothetical protein
MTTEGTKKISHGTNKEYTGNKNLVQGINREYKEGTKN